MSACNIRNIECVVVVSQRIAENQANKQNRIENYMAQTIWTQLTPSKQQSLKIKHYYYFKKGIQNVYKIFNNNNNNNSNTRTQRKDINVNIKSNDRTQSKPRGKVVQKQI